MYRAIVALLLVAPLAVFGRPIAGATVATPQEELVVFRGDRVFFDIDSAIPDDVALTQISAWAEWIILNPEFLFRIEGHTDDTGSAVYNRRLGLRRAMVVLDQLVEPGVNPGRLKPVSKGEDCPELIGLSEKARSANRRVVLRIDGTVEAQSVRREATNCGACC